MTFNEADSIRRKIEILKRRKSLLEVQAARKGIDIEPHVAMEIEDIEKDIQDLQGQLNIVSGVSTYQQSMNLATVLSGIIERMEHLNYGLHTLNATFSHLYKDTPLSRTSINTSPEFKKLADIINGRIESFASFYSINKILIPDSLDKHVIEYRNIVKKFNPSSEYVYDNMYTASSMLASLDDILERASTEARKLLSKS